MVGARTKFRERSPVIKLSYQSTSLCTHLPRRSRPQGETSVEPGCGMKVACTFGRICPSVVALQTTNKIFVVTLGVAFFAGITQY